MATEITIFIKIDGRKTGYQNKITIVDDIDPVLFDETIEAFTPEIHKWIKEGK